MLSIVLTAVVQVLVFAALPFLAHIATRRRPRGFLHSVGLYRPEARTVALALMLVLVVTPLVLAVLALPELRPAVLSPSSIAGRLRLLGPSASTVVVLLVFAFVQTALAEEILFRGFLGQRVMQWLGFGWGNTVQAVLFGAMHFLLFATVLGSALTPLGAAVLAIPPTLIGWALGYLKVRRGNGSIVPGWLAHGAANAIAYGVVVFVW